MLQLFHNYFVLSECEYFMAVLFLLYPAIVTTKVTTTATTVTTATVRCLAGTDWNATTAFCEPCPAGTAYSIDSSSCTPCPAGTVSLFPGALSPADCLPLPSAEQRFSTGKNLLPRVSVNVTDITYPMVISFYQGP